MGISDLASTSSAATKSGFNPTTLILIVVVVVAFYMLLIRPQRRKAQQAQQQQNTVEPGARVRTTAGMYATVVEVDGDDVVLEVSPGVEMRFMKRAIMDVVAPGTQEETGEETEDEVPVDETETDYYAESEDTEPEVEDAEPVAETDDETAYEQATGTKKD